MIRQCLLLSLLFIIQGCGTRNQTETTLKVSNSFSISSQAYPGGLIIHGKNLFTGEKFTQSLKDGVQFTTILNKGEWLLSAIGWQSTSKFYGPPHCGKVNTKLSNEQETVYISMNTTNCGDHFFSKGEVDSEKNVKKINFIGTCNTFFIRVPGPKEKISELIVNSKTSKSYCDDQNFPLDLKSRVSGIKIFGLNKKPHELKYLVGFESDCIGREEYSSTFSISDLRLPLGEIPIAIRTYKDKSCTEPVAEFIFKDGLDQGDTTQFDHLLLDDLSSYSPTTGTPTEASSSTPLKLILPSNDLKRGLSPFSALSPSFKKVTSLYKTTPTGNVTYDLRIPYGQSNIVLEEETDCSKIHSPYNKKCTLSKSRKVMIDIGINTDPVTVRVTTTNINKTNEYKDYKIFIEPPGFDQERSEVQGLIMKLIGHNADKKTARFFNVWDDNSHYGYLSEIRNMFHPDGAGGVIGIKNQDKTFEEACLEIKEDREIRLFDYEEKKDKWYRVVVSNITVQSEITPSPFICNSKDLKPSDCQDENIFDKKMTIFNQSYSKDNPIMRLKFSCTHPIGQFENLSFHDDDIYSLDNSHQRIINWNTYAENSSTYQRFEIITWSKHTNSEDETFEDKTMARVFNTSNSNLEGFSYESHKNGESPFLKSTFFKLESNTNNQNKLTFKTDENNNLPYSFILDSNYPQAQETIQNTTIDFKLPNEYGSFNDSILFSYEILVDEDFKSEFKLTPASH